MAGRSKMLFCATALFRVPAPFSSISFPARGKRYGLRSKACALCLRQHLDDLSDIEIVEVLLGIAALHDRRVYKALLQQRRLIELPADENELCLLEIGVAVAEYGRQADGLDLILVAAGMAAEIGKLLFIALREEAERIQRLPVGKLLKNR